LGTLGTLMKAIFAVAAGRLDRAVRSKPKPAKSTIATSAMTAQATGLRISCLL
jgi:hypothetical protein